jgi:predicted Zn-dependent peptidase
VFTSVRTDVTGPALREIVNELTGVAADGDRALTAEEIAANRDAEARSWLDAFGSPGGLVGLIAEFARYERPAEELATYLDQLRGASEESIRAALAELADPARQVILVVGDREKVEPQLKAAGFERIRHLTPEGEAAE